MYVCLVRSSKSQRNDARQGHRIHLSVSRVDWQKGRENEEEEANTEKIEWKIENVLTRRCYQRLAGFVFFFIAYFNELALRRTYIYKCMYSVHACACMCVCLARTCNPHKDVRACAYVNGRHSNNSAPITERQCVHLRANVRIHTYICKKCNLLARIGFNARLIKWHIESNSLLWISIICHVQLQ